MARTNGAGSWTINVREDLPPSGCTICVQSFEGTGVDAGPVDVICMACAEAIAEALSDYQKGPKDERPSVPQGGKEPYPSTATWPPTAAEPSAPSPSPEAAAPKETPAKRVRKASRAKRKAAA